MKSSIVVDATAADRRAALANAVHFDLSVPRLSAASVPRLSTRTEIELRVDDVDQNIILDLIL